jgi:hypothetical protein
VWGLLAADSVALVKLACPLPSRGTELAKTVAPSWKVTEPVVTGLPALVTAATKVTGCP